MAQSIVFVNRLRATYLEQVPPAVVYRRAQAIALVKPKFHRPHSTIGNECFGIANANEEQNVTQGL